MATAKKSSSAKPAAKKSPAKKTTAAKKAASTRTDAKAEKARDERVEAELALDPSTDLKREGDASETAWERPGKDVTDSDPKGKDPVNSDVTKDLAKNIDEDGQDFSDEPSIGERARTANAGRTYPPTGTESTNPNEPSPITPKHNAGFGELDDKANYDNPANIDANPLRNPEEPRERTGVESTDASQPSPVTPVQEFALTRGGRRIKLDDLGDVEEAETFDVAFASGRTFISTDGKKWVSINDQQFAGARADFAAVAVTKTY